MSETAVSMEGDGSASPAAWLASLRSVRVALLEAKDGADREDDAGADEDGGGSTTIA